MLGGGGDLQMALYHSMNASSVAGYHKVAGHSNPTIWERICPKFSHSQVAGMQKLWECTGTHELPPWNFHKHLIFLFGHQLNFTFIDLWALIHFTYFITETCETRAYSISEASNFYRETSLTPLSVVTFKGIYNADRWSDYLLDKQHTFKWSPTCLW